LLDDNIGKFKTLDGVVLSAAETVVGDGKSGVLFGVIIILLPYTRYSSFLS
jgi:hypothetical protein